MEFRKELVIRSATFWVVTGLFLAANVWSWIRHELHPICCDQEMTIGFPVPFHISGGIAGLSNFYPIGFILDITVLATVAITATWVARLLSGRK